MRHSGYEWKWRAVRHENIHSHCHLDIQPFTTSLTFTHILIKLIWQPLTLNPNLAYELDEPGAPVPVPVGHEAGDGGVGHQDVLPSWLTDVLEHGIPGEQSCQINVTEMTSNLCFLATLDFV